MATPVPVVSMMYFLVSLPPKTFIMVRPDFSATSMKLARGAESWDVVLDCEGERLGGWVVVGSCWANDCRSRIRRKAVRQRWASGDLARERRRRPQCMSSPK